LYSSDSECHCRFNSSNNKDGDRLGWQKFNEWRTERERKDSSSSSSSSLARQPYVGLGPSQKLLPAGIIITRKEQFCLFNSPKIWFLLKCWVHILPLVCTLYRTGNANRCHGYSLYKASTSIPIYIISWLRHNHYHVIPSSSVFWFKDKHLFF
jgi:hypothetical protein